ncbi:hypothetical protein BU17DRAFT_67009 [Hysterangium stoloniferum]|nr:hypothetical protein BU17DRAFT_67009 [Hysterangium stoloniferum]
MPEGLVKLPDDPVNKAARSNLHNPELELTSPPSHAIAPSRSISPEKRNAPASISASAATPASTITFRVSPTAAAESFSFPPTKQQLRVIIDISIFTADAPAAARRESALYAPEGRAEPHDVGPGGVGGGGGGAGRWAVVRGGGRWFGEVGGGSGSGSGSGGGNAGSAGSAGGRGEGRGRENVDREGRFWTRKAVVVGVAVEGGGTSALRAGVELEGKAVGERKKVRTRRIRAREREGAWRGWVLWLAVGWVKLCHTHGI